MEASQAVSETTALGGGIEIMYMIYFLFSTTPNTEHLQFFPIREQIAGYLNLTEARVQVSKS